MSLAGSIRIYTGRLMTLPFFHAIVSNEVNSTTGLERKGNAADTFVQFQKFISPV